MSSDIDAMNDIYDMTAPLRYSLHALRPFGAFPIAHALRIAKSNSFLVRKASLEERNIM